MSLGALVASLSIPALAGQPVPLEFDAGAVVTLDATAWYDLQYARHEVTPDPLTLAEILEGPDAQWYDTKDAT